MAQAVRSRSGRAQQALHGNSEQKITSVTNQTGKSVQKLQLGSKRVQKNIEKTRSLLEHQLATDQALGMGRHPLRTRAVDKQGKIRYMHVHAIGTKTLVAMVPAIATRAVPSCVER